MTERRAVACPDPKHGPTIGERLGAHLVRCVGVRWANVAPDGRPPRFELVAFVPSCGRLVATCGGCGGMTLSLDSAGGRCPCGFERGLRDEERAAMASGEPAARVQVAPAAPAPFELAPMPDRKRGAALPAPAKTRGKQPPKER